VKARNFALGMSQGRVVSTQQTFICSVETQEPKCEFQVVNLTALDGGEIEWGVRLGTIDDLERKRRSGRERCYPGGGGKIHGMNQKQKTGEGVQRAEKRAIVGAARRILKGRRAISSSGV